MNACPCCRTTFEKSKLNSALDNHCLDHPDTFPLRSRVPPEDLTKEPDAKAVDCSGARTNSRLYPTAVHTKRTKFIGSPRTTSTSIVYPHNAVAQPQQFPWWMIDAPVDEEWMDEEDAPVPSAL